MAGKLTKAQENALLDRTHSGAKATLSALESRGLIEKYTPRYPALTAYGYAYRLTAAGRRAVAEIKKRDER